MEKLKIEYRKVSELVPYARNARTHSDEQVGRIAASIERFGFTNPVLLNGEMGILAGHGRVMAAKLLGMPEVPTINIEGLSESEQRAYILADNKLALDAGWDPELLRGEIEFLLGKEKEEELLEITGFTEEEISKLLDTGELDEMPELDNFDTLEVHTMTMNVSTEDQETITRAIKQWKKDNPGGDKDLKGNITGIAIAAICREWLQ